MSLIEKIESIETPCARDLNWYYHGTCKDIEGIKAILKEGIKCGYLLGQESNINNGRYFISLSKDIGAQKDHSSFYSYRTVINIIIDDIKAHKCIKYFSLLPYLGDTRLPIRFSGWDDEFQAYKIIEPDKFIGIQCPLYYWVKSYLDGGTTNWFLVNLKKLIIAMKALENTLPLYDYSRLDGTSVHQINPDRFLEIYDEEIESLTDEERRILRK